MKNKLFLTLFVLSVAFFSCKKDEGDTAPVISIVKTMTQSPGGAAEVYTYDGEGRIQRIQNALGSRTEYSYMSDTVIETSYNIAGEVVYIKTMLLNGDGVVTASANRDSLGNLLGSTQYAYDVNKFRTEQREYDATGALIRTYKWTTTGEGNIGSFESIDPLVNTNNFLYWYIYSLEANNTIGNDNTGMKFNGTSSKNAMKVLNRSSYFLNNIRYTFRYTLDGSGRILTMSAYDHDGEWKYTNTYTY